MAAPINAETRAAALAELLAGEPLKSTARKFGISHQTLRAWRDAAGLDPVLTPSARDAIGAALDAYIVKALEVMTAQLDLARDLAWLRQHDPGGLAALHNAIAEKVARVVEAQEIAAVEEAEPTPLRRAS